MKRSLFLGLSFLACGIFILAAVLFAKTFIVKIRTTNLRETPKFYAQTVAVLKTGETVEQVGSQNGWIQVRTSKGLVGWIHLSSVAEKKFSLSAIDQPLKTEATAGEVALAAKGFNKQVEEKYKATHPGVSFVWVDKMLKIKIPSAQMEDFLKRGRLGEFRRAR